MPVPATTNPAPETPVYRPVSVLAITGFTLAVLHALGVVLIGVSAWRLGTPLLIPWILVLAGLGGALSAAAWLQIARSEGTRAGLGLAKWGWWLSLVFGVGYFSHIVFIEWAVRADSTSFANRWFDHLRNGDVHAAFFYTVAPAQRQGDNPADITRLRIRYQFGARGQRGPLAVFLDHEMVRTLQQAGVDGLIESQGVQSWEYIDGGYLAELKYRLRTPEGVYEIILPTWTGESVGPKQEFTGRQSYVLMNEQLRFRPRGQTVLGQRLRALRQSGCRFFDEWGIKLSQGRPEEAYFDTRAPKERPRLRAAYVARLLLFGLDPCIDPLVRWSGWAPLADAEVGHALCLPGSSDPIRQGLFRFHELQSANAGEIRDEVNDLLRRGGLGRTVHLQVPEGTQRFSSPWKIVSETFQLTVPIEIRLGTKYYLQGTAQLSLRHPTILQEVVRLQQTSPSVLSATDSLAPLPNNVAGSWQLEHIDLTNGVDVSRVRGND